MGINVFMYLHKSFQKFLQNNLSSKCILEQIPDLPQLTTEEYTHCKLKVWLSWKYTYTPNLLNIISLACLKHAQNTYTGLQLAKII